MLSFDSILNTVSFRRRNFSKSVRTRTRSVVYCAGKRIKERYQYDTAERDHLTEIIH